jgi:hypothetical protein
MINKFLENFGGHIGYAVRPGYRRRGFATEILGTSTDHRALGRSRRVLLTCDDDNLVCVTIIEPLGGVLERPQRPGDRLGSNVLDAMFVVRIRVDLTAWNASASSCTRKGLPPVDRSAAVTKASSTGPGNASRSSALTCSDPIGASRIVSHVGSSQSRSRTAL